MDLSLELNVLDLENKIEASIVIWKRKMNQKDSQSSWSSATSMEKREQFEERAETILILLKQRFPGLPQSSLEISKIESNKRIWNYGNFMSVQIVIHPIGTLAISAITAIVKTSVVCGPHLQTSAEEEVDQTSAVCRKKTNLISNNRCNQVLFSSNNKPLPELKSSMESRRRRWRSIDCSNEEGGRRRPEGGVRDETVAKSYGDVSKGNVEVGSSGDFGAGGGPSEVRSETFAGNVFPPADLEPCLPVRRQQNMTKKLIGKLMPA
ncbi:hypothetical protein LXL04_011408 [Taraxacum kok-saghyz]